MRQPVKQIAYKYCVNFANTEFPYQLTLSLRCKYCKIHSRSIFPDAINSIRRLAAERLQANDVSLLWRHSSWVRSRTLESAYRRPFLTVFGEFEPQNVVGHRVDPKKHFLTSQRVFWDISHKISCTGCFSRRVREKNKNKKERPYISRISPGAPLRPICTNFGLRVRLVDVINFEKFIVIG